VQVRDLQTRLSEAGDTPVILEGRCGGPLLLGGLRQRNGKLADRPLAGRVLPRRRPSALMGQRAALVLAWDGLSRARKPLTRVNPTAACPVIPPVLLQDRPGVRWAPCLRSDRLTERIAPVTSKITPASHSVCVRIIRPPRYVNTKEPRPISGRTGRRSLTDQPKASHRIPAARS
jgi:hypothetical protein